MSVDPHWGNVVLAMNMDGISGEAVFVDQATNKNIVVYGITTTTTEKSRFGASAKFNGTNSRLAVLDPDFDFRFGGEDFTIEFFANFNTLPGNAAFLSSSTASSTTSFSCWYGSASGLRIDAGSSYYFPWTPTIGLWHHIAFVRSGVLLRCFVDGFLVGTEKNIGTFAYPNTATQLNIGSGAPSLNAPFNGYLDELRITRGVARYLANFTPPDMPLPYAATYISGTVRDDQGNPAKRKVFAFDRSNGALAGKTDSSEVDGTFRIDFGAMQLTKCFVVALDDDLNVEYNALIIDRIDAIPQTV
jgi:hypothetical protein